MLPLRDNQPARIFPLWVILIIVLNVYIFYLELTAPNLDRFISYFALIPSLINLSDTSTIYPFVTSQFLHAGFIHLISNMWFLWIFGDNVEGAIGFFLFPFFYLGSGIVGGLMQYFILPTSTTPILGASGAVAGVLGAYFALFPHHSIKTLIPVFGFPAIVDIPASVMLFYWFFTQIFSGSAAIVTATVSMGGVAWFAHIGGFVTGWLIGKTLAKS